MQLTDNARTNINKAIELLQDLLDKKDLEIQRLRSAVAETYLTRSDTAFERDQLWTDNQRLRSLLVEIRRLSDPDYEGHKLLTNEARMENVHTHALMGLGHKNSSIDGHLETQHIDEFLAAPKKVKNTAVLSGWVWVHDHLFGTVYGHPDFMYGTVIHTSTILKMNDAKTLAETDNTIYTLENPVEWADASIRT